jgi:flavodoxin I
MGIVLPDDSMFLCHVLKNEPNKRAMETVIVYYSSNGSTEYAAHKLAKALAVPKRNIINVSNTTDFHIESFQNIILGCSTWNVNELPYDFEKFLLQIRTKNLNEKSIAIFGAGNQREYPHSFVNAIGHIYHMIKETTCNMVGKVSADGYSFTGSKAQSGNYFLGLPIDEETQGELTSERIKNWAVQLQAEFAKNIPIHFFE